MDKPGIIQINCDGRGRHLLGRGVAGGRSPCPAHAPVLSPLSPPPGVQLPEGKPHLAGEGRRLRARGGAAALPPPPPPPRRPAVRLLARPAGPGKPRSLRPGQRGRRRKCQRVSGQREKEPSRERVESSGGRRKGGGGGAAALRLKWPRWAGRGRGGPS